MPSFNVVSGGVWRTAKSIYVVSGGVWREAREAYVFSGGQWRMAFQAIRAYIANRRVSAVNTGFATAGRATAGYRLLANGTAAFYSIEANYRNESVIPGEWLIKGAASQFEVKARLVQGSAISGGDYLDQWLSLSADREWRIYALSNDAQGVSLSSELEIQIRAAGSGTVITTATINLSAFASREEF